jgi:hypothetical protein
MTSLEILFECQIKVHPSPSGTAMEIPGKFISQQTTSVWWLMIINGDISG